MTRIKLLLMIVLPVSTLAQSDTIYQRVTEFENGVPVRE